MQVLRAGWCCHIERHDVHVEIICQRKRSINQQDISPRVLLLCGFEYAPERSTRQTQHRTTTSNLNGSPPVCFLRSLSSALGSPPTKKNLARLA